MAQISLRIEDDVKKKAEQVCADIGMSLSTAINIYLKKLGREKRIPFEVAVDPFYSQENMDRLKKSTFYWFKKLIIMKGYTEFVYSIENYVPIRFIVVDDMHV